MLNRLGHSASYTVIEEVETELTFNADKRNLFTSEGLQLNKNHATGSAFDNYDRLVNTQSGKTPCMTQLE